ncbi:MAG TPA: DUF4397 domain-containing protein [Usitatibacter sp.]|nr:DUF4397 domain-containing protein [Usitatibacter sp.]
MKWLLALLAAAFLVVGCNKGGTNQNSTDLRALNVVVDAEPLDVLVDNDVKFTKVAAGTTTDFTNFDSGTRSVIIRSSTTLATLATLQINFPSDSRGTLVMFGKRAALGVTLLTNDTITPGAGNARVSFVGLAPDAGSVDFYLVTGNTITGATPTVAAVTAGIATPAVEVPGNNYNIIVTTAGTQDVVFQTSAPVNIAAGSTFTVGVVPSLSGKLVNGLLINQGSGTVTPLSNPIARVKAANGIPGDTTLNFKADGTVLLTAVPFTGVSSYVSTASGSHALQIEASNVPGTNIASITKTLDPARDFTILAMGTIAAPTLSVLADDNTVPSTGNSRLRFVNAVAGLNVDVLVNFASQATNIAPGTASPYFTIAAGTNYTITFTTPGGVNVVATISGAELDSGFVYSAYLFGTPTSARAILVRDR